MKIFSFGFEGIWLGGKAVVLAENEAKARELVTQRIQEEFLNQTAGQQRSLTLKAVFNLDEPQLVYFDNGDY